MKLKLELIKNDNKSKDEVPSNLTFISQNQTSSPHTITNRPVNNLQLNPEQLLHLLECSQIITSSLDIRSIKKKLTSRLKKVLHLRHCRIYRVHNRFKILTTEVSNSRQKMGPAEIQVNITEETYLGSCAYQNTSIHIKNYTDHIKMRTLPSCLQYQGNENTEVFYLPVSIHGQVHGVIEVYKDNFTSQDILFLEEVSTALGQTLQNIGLFENIQHQLLQICEALGDTIVKKDRYTGGHTKRVGIFSEMIGKEFGLSFDELNDLKLSAVLHDIGKIGIEDSILKKQQKLTQEEYEIMKNHPRYGDEILGHIEGLDNVIAGIKFHHERHDGRGYPYGLKGDEIPITAQIIALADAFDAMISTRPYSKGMPPMTAYHDILLCSGTQFSPDAVKAFKNAFEKTHMYKAAQNLDQSENEKDTICSSK